MGDNREKKVDDKVRFEKEYRFVLDEILRGSDSDDCVSEDLLSQIKELRQLLQNAAAKGVQHQNSENELYSLNDVVIETKLALRPKPLPIFFDLDTVDAALATEVIHTLSEFYGEPLDIVKTEPLPPGTDTCGSKYRKVG